MIDGRGGKRDFDFQDQLDVAAGHTQHGSKLPALSKFALEVLRPGPTARDGAIFPIGRAAVLAHFTHVVSPNRPSIGRTPRLEPANEARSPQRLNPTICMRAWNHLGDDCPRVITRGYRRCPLRGPKRRHETKGTESPDR